MSQTSNNSGDNVFEGISARPGEAALVEEFFASQDYAAGSVRGIKSDLRKLAAWFVEANQEPFSFGRLTTRDLADFRDHCRRQKEQAVSTVNRSLVSVRRCIDWLVSQGRLSTNPAKAVKELQRQQLAPQGLDQAQVRRLFRELELRGDVRAMAIFSMMIYTGARVSDVVGLEVGDLSLNERSGIATYRFGKGNKQRQVPIPLPARRALQAYLDVRPPLTTSKVFVGERGALTTRGVRALADKYAAISGVSFTPHTLRHCFAKKFLSETKDLAALACLLGHSNLNTTQIYVRQSAEQLAEAAERVVY